MNALLKTKVDAFSQVLAEKAVAALITEARLTPKPGLVDLRGAGSHTDMDYALLEDSANSLYSAFYQMAQASYARKPDQTLRNQIGAIGRAGEKTMMQVTNGVNTHRGAIWSLGLMISAYACCEGKASKEAVINLASCISRISDQHAPTLLNKGRFISKKFNVPGAREEAQQGFLHVKKALAKLQKDRLDVSEEKAQIHALLSVMSTLTDTCILSRGGSEGLRFVQEKSKTILDKKGFASREGEILFQEFDRDMKEKRLSPGGSADLLATTLLVDSLT